MARLKEIEDAEESCQDKIFELIYELDEKVKDWKTRIDKLRESKKELEVKLVRIQLDVSEKEEVESFKMILKRLKKMSQKE